MLKLLDCDKNEKYPGNMNYIVYGRNNNSKDAFTLIACFVLMFYGHFECNSALKQFKRRSK